ncbi:cytochrome d ubiquinol oxidase subunit 2 [Gammaproteobacteria bacterium SCGC AG-212-F23]|nr:cytochrome d ubiquinol oxidase subunit 2 [Gammaproteobacteria bacterium SCGC AG-212-F23]
MFDYETLRVIWWMLLGVLLIAFAVMDGFDLGIGMLLHYVARNNEERRVVINSIGPVWEGNQVWLILGAGAIFAAWPDLYAISFSGFYFAMLLVLFALILRPVGFKYRSKLHNIYWRAMWDLGIFIAGLVPALCFGIALGNVLQGVPFYLDDMLRDFYTGSFRELFNPFAILCGLVSVVMLIMHGGVFLAIKTAGNIQKRAIHAAKICALLTILLFAIAGYWIVFKIAGYILTNDVSHIAASNPMHKQVMLQVGAWINNYKNYHALLIVPLSAFIGALAVLLLTSLRCYRLAWIFSAIAISSIIMTVGVSMFPFMLPSITHPEMSLLVWDSSSSQATLTIMLIASAVFIPLIVLYTGWVYYVLRGKVTQDEINKNTNAY